MNTPSSKGYLSVIIILLVLVLIGIGYFIYNGNKKQNETAQFNNLVTQSSEGNFQEAMKENPSDSRASGEAFIKNKMQSFVPIAQIYYSNHSNYGAADGQSFCYGPEAQAAVDLLQQLNKGLAQFQKFPTQCKFATYPAQAFTITAPSLYGTNDFYCVDSKGFAGVLDNANNQFQFGVKCQ